MKPTREGLWGWTRYEEWIYICARKGRRPLNCSSAMQWYWFRFDKGRMPGRRSSTVGSRRVRFGSRARTRKRRCTILAATYVDLDLTDSSNWTQTQRRTTSSGLDERESLGITTLIKRTYMVDLSVAIPYSVKHSLGPKRLWVPKFA